jgi:hypothetical protein
LRKRLSIRKIFILNYIHIFLMKYNPISMLTSYYRRAHNFVKSLFHSGELEKRIEQQDPPEELRQRLHEHLEPVRRQLAYAATYRAAMGDRRLRPWKYMRPPR